MSKSNKTFDEFLFDRKQMRQSSDSRQFQKEQKTLINNDVNKQKSKPRVPAPKKEKTKDQHTN